MNVNSYNDRNRADLACWLAVLALGAAYCYWAYPSRPRLTSDQRIREEVSINQRRPYEDESGLHIAAFPE
jgi:hypothetical protein